MGKRLTKKEKEEKTISKIVQRIKSLEKVYPQDLVERACFRYKDANVKKRNAEKEMAELEEKLQEAKSRLKEK